MAFIFFTIKVSVYSIYEFYDNYQQRKHLTYSYLQEIKQPTSNEHQKVAQEIEAFFKDLKIQGINPQVDDIYFGFIVDKKKLQLENGACIWNPSNPKVAVFSVNPEILNSPVSLKTTIYHELGHCVLGLDHNNLIIGSHKGVEIPASIMHEAAINDQYVYDHFEVYKQKLFQQGYNNTSYNPGYLQFILNQTVVIFMAPIFQLFKLEDTYFKLIILVLKSLVHSLALLYLVAVFKTNIIKILGHLSYLYKKQINVNLN